LSKKREMKKNVPVARDGTHDWSSAFLIESIDVGGSLKSPTHSFVVAVQSSTM
jgi:hypothetical protein